MTALPAQAEPAHQVRHALADVRRHLRKSALKLLGYLLVAYLILRLIPTLNEALHGPRTGRSSWARIADAIVLAGAVADRLRHRLAAGSAAAARCACSRRDCGAWTAGWIQVRVAWAQLGGGLVVPGGSLGGMGVGGFFHFAANDYTCRAVRTSSLPPERRVGSTCSFLITAIDGVVALDPRPVVRHVLARRHPRPASTDDMQFMLGALRRRSTGAGTSGSFSFI